MSQLFSELANLMELYGENPFKIRSYRNIQLLFRKMGDPILEMSPDQINALKGVGAAISAKIEEIKEKGTFDTLERYRDKTPVGIRDLLGIKGLGPKKVKQVWDELGVQDAVELWYACNENRLVELKGFGYKTQEDLKKLLEYFFKSKDKFLYAGVEIELESVLTEVAAFWPSSRIMLVGDARRKMPVLEKLELLIEKTDDMDKDLSLRSVERISGPGEPLKLRWNEMLELTIHTSDSESFGMNCFLKTGPSSWINELDFDPGTISASEENLFEKLGLNWIPPELRDHPKASGWAREGDVPDLLDESDIRGLVHAHSTWSDGIHSLKEMADAAIKKGLEYLLITDHSKSAFYAGGLQVDELYAQWEEIDSLNESLKPFRILKGIESDILSDGSLDYPDDVLAGFDGIIASIHSNLKMDEDKATERLIRAVEHPLCSMLGHPTGRLLLAREGYPIDHMKVIDACAASGVAIEINANPRRLDLDWTWVPYAIEKGVLISINPDAHSIAGIDDIRYGVMVARKAGLTPANCLNALGAQAFLNTMKKQ